MPAAPTTERQAPSLNVRQKILAAAVSLSDEAESFSVEDLAVRAWTLFPETFSLRGHPHPDSSRVHAKLSGADGLLGLGWIERVGGGWRVFRVTRRGRAAAVARRVEKAETLAALARTAAAYAEHRSIKKTARVLGLARSTVRAQLAKGAGAVVVPAPSPPRELLPDADVAAVGTIAKAEALRKFLRGSLLCFEDACAFWGLSQKRPKRVRDRLHDVERLLKRVVESFGSEGATDPRLPALSICYGLLNLHRLMSGRFERDLDALAAREGAST